MSMFTFFATMESTKPQPRNWTWEDFVADVMKGHKEVAVDQKPFVWHFNASTYKDGGRRIGNDIATVNAVIVDYDNYVDWDKAIAIYIAFHQLEFVAFTSFNHQRAKFDGDRLRDKFRIVFPFKEPVTFTQYKQIAKYLEDEFAPKADPCIDNPNQIYTYNYAPSESIDESQVYYNEGKYLDWETLPKTVLEPEYVPGITSTGYKGGKEAAHYLEEDFVFRTAKGSVRFGDVKQHISQVYCPHHVDKSPGSFLNKKGQTIYHVCSSCGTTKIKKPEKTPFEIIDQMATRTVIPKPKTKEEIEAIKCAILGVDPNEPVLPFTRDRRAKLIQDRCMKKRANEMLLEAFEGFGKSYYAVLEARRGTKVLFACSSNEQAAEQKQSFEALGLKVQLIPGREYRLRTEYKITAETYEETHPWDMERLDENRTKAKIMVELKKTEEEADAIWEQCSPPTPDWSKHDIICTTIARTMAYGKIQVTRATYVAGAGLIIADQDRMVPADAIVFFDDPDKKFFTKYEPYDQKYIDRQVAKRKKRSEKRGEEDFPFKHKPQLIIQGEVVKEIEINKRVYFVRPNFLMLGYGLFDARIVFTTTEILTTYLIKDMYPNIYHPKLMPDQKMLAGDITMIKTNITSAKRDGFVLPIAERLKKEGYEFEVIADGMGARFNLVNSKGQNVLADTDTVIEISEPHFEDVIRYMDELHWNSSDGNTIKVVLALDALQQAIGRNSGYRWSDRSDNQRKRCVVLCEPKLHAALIETMRYHVNTVITKVEDRASLVRDYKTLEDGLCWFLTYTNRYLVSGIDHEREAFKNDVESVIASREAMKGIRFKKRLVTALQAKIDSGKEDSKVVEKCEKYVGIWG